MSPHLIIILMISSCTLLVLLLFAVRKRSMKKLGIAPTEKANSILPDLNNINLPGLENLIPKPISVPIREIKEDPSSELIELINRYKFFQGKNLEHFTSYAKENNWEKIEQLLQEKFQAQGKTNAQQLAQETGKKLQLLQHS